MPVAIITGASSGIGRSVAFKMAALKYDLLLAARKPERLATTVDEIMCQYEHFNILGQPTNVGSPGDVHQLIDIAYKKYGRIDVLINNAGNAPLHPLGEQATKKIDRLFAVNVFGPALAIDLCWNIMAKQESGGRIINVSSVASIDPFDGFLMYGATKAAMNSFARSVCNEGKASNIKGFSVAPGAVETPLLRKLISKEELPEECTLSPEVVADVIVECAVGKRDDENGKTIWVTQDGVSTHFDSSPD